MLNKKIERDDDSKKTHPALETGPVPTSAIDQGASGGLLFWRLLQGLLVKAAWFRSTGIKALFDIFCISRGISNARATACPDRPDDSLVGSRICPNQALAKRAGANEVRYFTSIDGLMAGNADVVLKETRQGKNVTAAVLDVCYPTEKAPIARTFCRQPRRQRPDLDRATQSLGDKLPVTVKLTRRPTGDTFEFRARSARQTVTEVTSTDNSDLSEKEFQDNQATMTASRQRPRILPKFPRKRLA